MMSLLIVTVLFSGEGILTAEQLRVEQVKQDAEVQALANDPRVARLVLSVDLCDAKTAEKEAFDKIKEEKENAKIGGVVDLSALHYLQSKVAMAHKAERGYASDFRRLGTKPLSCVEKAVVRALKCVNVTADRDLKLCDGDGASAFLTLVAEWSRDYEGDGL